jgi:NADPH:quinone reductase-like Zn-dependent oxidoreductase
MKGTMKVAMMNEPGRFDFEEKPIPEVKPGYVLVKLEVRAPEGTLIHPSLSATNWT